MIRLALQAVRMKGGLAVAICKAYQVVSREGFAGVKRGLERATNYGVNAQQSRKRYAKWLKLYDQAFNSSRESMLRRIMSMPEKPLISILVATYNTDPKWLSEAITSCQTQLYPDWELCITDDASTDSEVRDLLETVASTDKRIKLIFREHRGGVAAALNSALEIARGRWVTLLGQSDRLSAHALFHLADTAAGNKGVQIIYSDEDKLNEKGERYEPYFKCDWNRDLFYSQNMTSHLTAYRHTLVKSVSGFRPGFEGAHDYDLTLRCIERIKPEQICHIPKILYHWRIHGGSTALSANAKPHALTAACKALQEHFSRIESRAQVHRGKFGFRVRHPLPDNPPLISLIIPTRNGLALLKQCIDSITARTTYPNYEIIIVDNDSDDPGILAYFETLSKQSNISVLRDIRPFNYSALNNQAVEQARGELVGLLNNDIEVISKDWLEEMVSQALRPDIGAVGAKLFYPDDTIQHGGVVLGIGGCAGHAHKGFQSDSPGYFGRAQLVSNFSAVTAACLVVKKSLYLDVGGLDEEQLAVAFNDVDFCLRLNKAGYRTLWTPYAELYHHESASRGKDDTPAQKARLASEESYMITKWGDLIAYDPCYSPNLTLEHENFSYAFPPREHPVN